MKKILLLLIAFFWYVMLFSQTLTPIVVSTAGELFSNSSSSLNWTLGETVTATFSGKDQHLTQGFQQPQYVIYAFDGPQKEQYSIKLYPNPARDFINLKVTSNEKPQSLNIELFDLMGNILYETKMTNLIDQFTININQFSTSIILLRITDMAGKEIMQYKIIKVRY